MAAKGLKSGHCEDRSIKRNFDDFDESKDNSNNGARDQERRAKDKYKKKDDKRSAKLEVMIQGKIRVKTAENRSQRMKD